MIKALYNSVVRLKNSNKSAWKYLYKINKVIVNVIYPLTQRWNNSYGLSDNDVIVSLTTYPARVKTVWITIASLLNQSYKPSKVLLYLSKEQFPNEYDDLPNNLLRLQKRGLEIVFVEDDLKPHKKYFYAFRDYRDKLVITADDDIFYPENHIEQFVKAAQEFPNAVICNRSHEISIDEEKKCFRLYKYWKNNSTAEPDFLTLPVGCNGVLYKPELFTEDIFSVENIKNCALFTDDLWLKAMEIISGIKAYNYCDSSLIYFDNIFTMNTGLWHLNTDNDTSGNDVAWGKIVEAYPEVEKRLFRTLGCKKD